LVKIYLFLVSLSNLFFRTLLGNPFKSSYRLNLYHTTLEKYLTSRRNKRERDINFSIVIPFHQKNRHSFLLRALKSLEENSYEGLEVIVIDQTENLQLQELRKVFSGRLQIVPSKPVKSSVARNIGKALSKNDFLIFLDDDNYFHKNHFRLLRLLIHKFEHFQVLYVGCITDFSRTKFSFFPFYRRALLHRNLSDTNAFVFRRESFIDFQIWDPDQLGCEDWRMICDLVCAGISIKSFPIPSVFLTSDAPNRVTLNHDFEYAKFRAVEKFKLFLES
jgi:glycosyltransferase involved in cell wall biosynthesis